MSDALGAASKNYPTIRQSRESINEVACNETTGSQFPILFFLARRHTLPRPTYQLDCNKPKRDGAFTKHRRSCKLYMGPRVEKGQFRPFRQITDCVRNCPAGKG